ncbi:MAG: hypothetical protein NTY03_01095 [Candidatus Bathyarchaeota archaeon]|nr:hypothetical protein [Candidatus Bathyarchaeota archaeon]
MGGAVGSSQQASVASVIQLKIVLKKEPPPPLIKVKLKALPINIKTKPPRV